MSSEDERTTATLTAEDEPEQAEGAWYFNISDDARRREADLTRDLRRALVDEYRQQDAKTKRKRLFGLLPAGSGSAESEAAAVPAFLPRPQAQREDSSGPVPHRPSMRLAGRAGRAQPAPVEEAAPAEPAWTPRFLRESDGQPADLPQPAPLRQPPTEISEDVAFDVAEETSDWFDEPQAAPEAPVRPRTLRRAPALYAGEDDWTTALVPSTLAALAAAELASPIADAVTPVAEAFMRLARDEEPEWDATPQASAMAPHRNADVPAAASRLRTLQEDDWQTEPLAALASWDASAPVARRSPAPDASLASWFDEAFQEEDPEPPTPVNRFAREAPETAQTTPAPLRRAKPQAASPAQDDWTTELTLAIASSALTIAPAPDQEAEPEPFGKERRRTTPPAEPTSGATSRWDEMIESSRGNTGSIVEAMREVWADASTAEEPAPRRRRSLRGLRQEPEQRVESEAEPSVVEEAAPDVSTAHTDEPSRLVGKLGGIIRRRRHDESADAAPQRAEAAAPIEAAQPAAEAEIPATLWKELFGDPDTSGAGREPLPFPAVLEHRQGVHTFADPVPAEELPVDEDISLEEIFGEAAPDAAPQAPEPTSLDDGELLPPAPVWVDDDADEQVAFETMSATEPLAEEEPGEASPANAPLEEVWTSEPLVAITGTGEAPPPATQEGVETVSDPGYEADTGIAALTPAAPETADWGDLGGSALPYDIGWPEPAGEAHPDMAAADMAASGVASVEPAFAVEEDEAPDPAAGASEVEVAHPWQPEDVVAAGGIDGLIPEDQAQHEAVAEPVDGNMGAAEAAANAEPEPDLPHDAVRPGSAYSGFKPIQAATQEADGDDWEAFFGVEQPDQEGEAGG